MISNSLVYNPANNGEKGSGGLRLASKQQLSLEYKNEGTVYM